jgi:signal peptidase II
MNGMDLPVHHQSCLYKDLTLDTELAIPNSELKKSLYNMTDCGKFSYYTTLSISIPGNTCTNVLSTASEMCSKMSKWYKTLVIMLILISSVGCDQVTKSAAETHLATAAPLSYLGDTFRLHFTTNTGSILGLGSELPETLRLGVMVSLSSLALVFLAVFLWQSDELNRMSLFGGALILGGGFSNLLDRLFRGGEVVDFMNMGIGNLRTGVFNIADVAIMVGIGMLLLWVMTYKEPIEEDDGEFLDREYLDTDSTDLDGTEEIILPFSGKEVGSSGDEIGEQSEDG